MSMNNESSEQIQVGKNQEKYSSYRQMVKDIEFVQQLANPRYVIELVLRGYFFNQQFRSYLRGLKYLYRPQFMKLVCYPEGFYNLQLMQEKGFPEKMKDQNNRNKFIIDCLNRNTEISKGFVN